MCILVVPGTLLSSASDAFSDHIFLKLRRRRAAWPSIAGCGGGGGAGAARAVGAMSGLCTMSAVAVGQSASQERRAGRRCSLGRSSVCVGQRRPLPVNLPGLSSFAAAGQKSPGTRLRARHFRPKKKKKLSRRRRRMRQYPESHPKWRLALGEPVADYVAAVQFRWRRTLKDVLVSLECV